MYVTDQVITRSASICKGLWDFQLPRKVNKSDHVQAKVELWLGHPRTVVFEVPNAQGFISGGGDQHQAAVGGKGEIPNNVSVIHQIQQQCSWKSNTGLNTKKVKGK